MLYYQKKNLQGLPHHKYLLSITYLIWLLGDKQNFLGCVSGFPVQDTLDVKVIERGNQGFYYMLHIGSYDWWFLNKTI